MNRLVRMYSMVIIRLVIVIMVRVIIRWLNSRLGSRVVIVVIVSSSRLRSRASSYK